MTLGQFGHSTLLVGNARPLTKALLSLGQTKTVCLLLARTSSSLKDDLTCFDAVVVLDDASASHWISAARWLHGIHRFDTLCSWDERYQTVGAQIADSLGLACFSLQTARLINDKLEMRKHLGTKGLSNFAAARVENANDIRRFGSANGWPLVVKPICGAASSGVSLVHGPYESDPAWEWAKTSRWASREGIMVEQFAEGEEVSLDCFSENGRHFVIGTSSHIKGSDHPIEFGHVVPAAISPEALHRATAYVFSCLDALEVKTGISSSEILISGESTTLVETHLRPPGGELTFMYGDRLGVDLFQLMARQALGESVEERLARATAAELKSTYQAVWFSGPFGQGVVASIAGHEQARGCRGVTEVSILAKVGDAVSLPRSGMDRALHIRATGATAQEAVERARSASELVRFTVDAEPFRPALVYPPALRQLL